MGDCLRTSASIDWKPTRVAEQFFDTKVLLYLLSGDARKADRAETALAEGGILSVQVLNEFASVATRKIGMPLDEVREVLTSVRAVCKVVPITEATHDKGIEIADRYRLSVYDAIIIATALLAECKILLSEDMQDGQIIDGSLKIRNPFR